MRIKVAGIVAEYEPFHSEYFEEKLSEYKTDEPAEMQIKYEVVEKVELPEHKVIKQIKDTFVSTLENGNYLVYLKSPSSGKIINSYEFSPDYSFNYARTIHIERTERVNLNDAEREYLKSGAIFNNRLLYLGGATLHGSSIEYNGEGVVFSAPCGTGKSTHTSLWKKVFGDKVGFINDDKPCVRFFNGVPTISGAPWSGKTNLQANKTVPLKAIVFIERAETNSIERLDTATSICFLKDQSFSPFYDASLGLKNIELIEKLITSVPVYILRCNMEDDAAITAKNSIFKE